jgi:hypothetical protein
MLGIAPEVFQLGDDTITMVVDLEGADDETVLDAARAFPVDGIGLIDEFEDVAGVVGPASNRTVGREPPAGGNSDNERGPVRGPLFKFHPFTLSAVTSDNRVIPTTSPAGTSTCL